MAGQGSTHAEWIRDTAAIPVGEYEGLLAKFNPVKFNAVEFVRIAHEADEVPRDHQQHHDGFCLFEQPLTDWDVMSTPFKRDIMKELSDACKKDGGVLRMYHSIKDRHHPDYLPRRPWERSSVPRRARTSTSLWRNQRTTEGVVLRQVRPGPHLV